MISIGILICIAQYDKINELNDIIIIIIIIIFHHDLAFIKIFNQWNVYSLKFTNIKILNQLMIQNILNKIKINYILQEKDISSIFRCNSNWNKPKLKKIMNKKRKNKKEEEIDGLIIYI